MEKTLRTFLFSKIDGHLMAEVSSDTEMSYLNTDNVYIKQIEMSDVEIWDGDYFTGRVVNLEERPVVREDELRYNANVKVLERYPLHKQLNLIMNVIRNNGLALTPEFEEMCEHIDYVREELKEKIAVYSSNPQIYYWIPKDST